MDDGLYLLASRRELCGGGLVGCNSKHATCKESALELLSVSADNQLSSVDE